ncbi:MULTISPECIES: ABC transporter substrate-binding protein [Arthrobacter]|uniref:ABC transporter substrate-binding protein n=1 Tax=unclassified Arthrobacter TaxID=235627 RepID=UPI0024BA25E9|nr:ABC transporter substrate-binding protein [Arthrobacter sp. H35-MC1]MDJ0317650.1 ABC transporter substrate-binding protein [Arthrobacter sp. H35-MC1]
MHRKLVVALGIFLLLMGTTVACTPEPITTIHTASEEVAQVPLKVATPEVPDGVNPQEGALLAHVYAAALNAAGVKAEIIKPPLNQGAVVSGVEAGSVDIVPVYSRLALSAIAPADTDVGAGDVIDALKTSLPTGIGLLDTAKTENSNVTVVTALTAEKYQLKSLSDLGKVCEKLGMGGSAEFKVKERGLPGLGNDYNCTPKSYKALMPTLDFNDVSILWSLLRDEIQIAQLPNSSPAIADNSLVILSDPKGLFLSQNVVPLVAKNRVPAEVQAVLNRVSAALNTEELANLNRLSQDRHYGDLSEVATIWLVQQGLVKASS